MASDLVQRLDLMSRNMTLPYHYRSYAQEAATRIEQLEAQRSKEWSDEEIIAAWDCWPKVSITSRAGAVSFVRHLLAHLTGERQQ